MSFTDDELAQLRDVMDMTSTESDVFAYWKVGALLARLEAAEALLPAWQQQNGEPETRDVWIKAEQAWRKATGK